MKICIRFVEPNEMILTDEMMFLIDKMMFLAVGGQIVVEQVVIYTDLNSARHAGSNDVSNIRIMYDIRVKSGF